MFIKKDDYEFNVLNAFKAGMKAAYGIDIENAKSEEEKAINSLAEMLKFRRKDTK